MPIPVDPLEWRPQRPIVTRRPPEVKDPILEPLWSGIRALLHYESTDDAAGRIRMIDGDGEELTLAEPAVVREASRAIAADDAVIDGVLTWEATRGGEGTALITESRASVSSMLFSREPTVEIERKDEDTHDVLAFVALDLLRVDGQSLLNLPLLERKRLLESVVVQSERVRVSVYTRPPVNVWVSSWKAAGLRGAMIKGANSRYVPGGQSAEWRTVTRIAGRG
jgi:bifunctional non-homologous end joining protein LigD